MTNLFRFYKYHNNSFLDILTDPANLDIFLLTFLFLPLEMFKEIGFLEFETKQRKHDWQSWQYYFCVESGERDWHVKFSHWLSLSI